MSSSPRSTIFSHWTPPRRPISRGGFDKTEERILAEKNAVLLEPLSYAVVKDHLTGGTWGRPSWKSLGTLAMKRPSELGGFHQNWKSCCRCSATGIYLEWWMKWKLRGFQKDWNGLDGTGIYMAWPMKTRGISPEIGRVRCNDGRIGKGLGCTWPKLEGFMGLRTSSANNHWKTRDVLDFNRQAVQHCSQQWAARHYAWFLPNILALMAMVIPSYPLSLW